MKTNHIDKGTLDAAEAPATAKGLTPLLFGRRPLIRGVGGVTLLRVGVLAYPTAAVAGGPDKPNGAPKTT